MALLQQLALTPPKFRRMSETPTTTTSQKSIAINLAFILEYASNLYCSAFGAPRALGSKEREILSVLIPFVSHYARPLYCNTPPIRIEALLRKSWWLWSPGCSPNITHALRLHPQGVARLLSVCAHLSSLQLWVQRIDPETTQQRLQPQASSKATCSLTRRRFDFLRVIF